MWMQGKGSLLFFVIVDLDGGLHWSKTSALVLQYYQF